MRVLGSFPTRGQLLGPIREALDLLARENGEYVSSSSSSISSGAPGFVRPTSLVPPRAPPAATDKPLNRLKIGVIGFGKFGQFLTQAFTKHHDVFVVSRDDMVRFVNVFLVRGA